MKKAFREMNQPDDQVACEKNKKIQRTYYANI
jgi:hypothetical protein